MSGPHRVVTASQPRFCGEKTEIWSCSQSMSHTAQGPDFAPAQAVGGEEESMAQLRRAPGPFSTTLNKAAPGPTTGARNIGEAISPSHRHRTDQVRMSSAWSALQAHHDQLKA
jgi:hypothetical protein